MAQPFIASSRRGDTWFSVGITSSFPNITEAVALSEQQQCNDADEVVKRIGCKVFHAPDADFKKAVQISDDPRDQVDISLRRGEQVLVFQFRGKFHAMDNVCTRFLRSTNAYDHPEMSSLILSSL